MQVLAALVDAAKQDLLGLAPGGFNNREGKLTAKGSTRAYKRSLCLLAMRDRVAKASVGTLFKIRKCKITEVL